MEEQDDSARSAGQPPVELGPMEKIEEGEQPPGSRTPGAQKPESEVQTEVNPNTE